MLKNTPPIDATTASTEPVCLRSGTPSCRSNITGPTPRGTRRSEWRLLSVFRDAREEGGAPDGEKTPASKQSSEGRASVRKSALEAVGGTSTLQQTGTKGRDTGTSGEQGETPSGNAKDARLTGPDYFIFVVLYFTRLHFKQNCPSSSDP